MREQASNDHLDDVLDIITLLARKSRGVDYIFRGEPQHYDKVSSSLYREYGQVEEETFQIETVQGEILEQARKYTDETDEVEILTQLQHYGGKTNLIDFTTDTLTALFFACDGSPDEDGRVVMLRKAGESIDYTVMAPRNPVNRIIAQKSVFVRPLRGFVEPDDSVAIRHDLKQPILEYLKSSHGISTETIYNDLFGFIRVQHIHQSAYGAFYVARSCNYQGEHEKAIGHYSEAIRLNPGMTAAYLNRGVSYRYTENHDLAMRDFGKALSLDQRLVKAYLNRGMLYSEKGEHNLALRDLDLAAALQPDNPDIYLVRASVRTAAGDHEGASRDSKRAAMLQRKAASANMIHRLHLTARTAEGGPVSGMMFRIDTDTGYEYRQTWAGEIVITLPSNLYGEDARIWLTREGYDGFEPMDYEIGDSFSVVMKPTESNEGAPEIVVAGGHSATPIGQAT